jgi:hypothetical protein
MPKWPKDLTPGDCTAEESEQSMESEEDDGHDGFGDVDVLVDSLDALRGSCTMLTRSIVTLTSRLYPSTVPDCTPAFSKPPEEVKKGSPFSRED